MLYLLGLATLFVSSNTFTSCRRTSHIRIQQRQTFPSLLNALQDPEENITEDESDPRKALEQFGSLFTQVQEIATEGSSWDSETLETKTQEFVRTYLRIFVPGIGYALTSFTVLLSTFSLCLLVLNLSGRGYSDIIGAVSSIEPIRNVLEKADGTWGNIAIALVCCEILSPLILGVTLALTPRTMAILKEKLEESGWGEDNIEERAADILRLTG